MRKPVSIRNSNKIKNEILRVLLVDKSLSIVKLHELIPCKPICGDVSAVKVLAEGIRDDGFIDLIPITETGLSNSYIATINHRGIVFVKGGEAYSNPTFFTLIVDKIKAHINSFIFTVGTGLLIAFLAKILGWI